MKRQIKTTVSVTDIADYAADPAGHIQRNGKAKNKKAARYGDRIHSQRDLKGGTRLLFRCLVIVLIAGAVWFVSH